MHINIHIYLGSIIFNMNLIMRMEDEWNWFGIMFSD